MRIIFFTRQRLSRVIIVSRHVLHAPEFFSRVKTFQVFKHVLTLIRMQARKDYKITHEERLADHAGGKIN